MKVRATQKGYYGEKIREVGDVFDITDNTPIGRWMEPVKAAAPVEEVKADEPTPSRGGRRHKAVEPAAPSEDNGEVM